MRVVACCWLIAGLLGCGRRGDLDGERRDIAGLQTRTGDYPLTLGGRAVRLDLFDNRAAAAVHRDGALVIECGTADFAKYVEGGYRQAWVLDAEADGLAAALLAGQIGEISLPIDRDPGGPRGDGKTMRLGLRVRAAVPAQLASVFVNDQRVGDLAMPRAAWDDVAIEIPAALLVDGENRVRLFFRTVGDIEGQRAAAAIARIAIGGAAVTATPVLRAASVEHEGGRLEALSVAAPARLSYYAALPPEQAELAFVAAGTGALSVQVAGARSGAATTLWTGQGDGTWREVRVDLAEHAGEVVRIDLGSTGGADWGRPRLTVAAAPGPSAGAAAPPVADHVIVWVISSLRADREGGAAVPTPALARLAARAIRFSHALTSAPAPGPAHVALLTGTRPAGDRLPDGVATLGERFRDAGHATALYSGNGFVHDGAGFARGFEVYENPMRRSRPYGAHVLWQEARRQLQRHRAGRTFTYLATVEPHLPYTPSAASLAAEWSGPSPPVDPARTVAFADAVADGTAAPTTEERRFIEALYDAEVRDADAALGEMLADLDHLGLADRTAVIVVGDHGEELWERGGLGHGRTLYQEALRVPLLVSLPGGLSGGRTVDDWVELVDVYSTALALAGLSPDGQAQGDSLLPAAGSTVRHPDNVRPVFATLPGRGRAMILGRYKLLAPARGADEIYDLVADPDERHDLAGTVPLVERLLRTSFGIGVAYEAAWSRRRWGDAGNTTAAFAADHGL